VPQLNAALVPAPAQVVVRFTGDADLSTAPFVADVLVQAAGLGTPQVVVDLGSARFWDCSGLHALATCTRELEADGRACRIVGALPATRQLIAMANLAGELRLDRIPSAPAGGPTTAARRPTHPSRPAPATVTGDLVASGSGR
jgi:anti-anti-sigma factor